METILATALCWFIIWSPLNIVLIWAIVMCYKIWKDD